MVTPSRPIILGSHSVAFPPSGPPALASGLVSELPANLVHAPRAKRGVRARGGMFSTRERVTGRRAAAVGSRLGVRAARARDWRPSPPRRRPLLRRSAGRRLINRMIGLSCSCAGAKGAFAAHKPLSGASDRPAAGTVASDPGIIPLKRYRPASLELCAFTAAPSAAGHLCCLRPRVLCAQIFRF